jgi:hypothetical protein
MAIPRVFISSTCYDLSEVRDSLVDFIRSFGFEPVLSETGDVFYHPDIHTHDSCLKEIENCQLFILIIGGRFGGSYVADTKKSIVNAEYNTAIEKQIPVFTFVKKNVHSDHHVYLKNKTNSSLKDIVFPSIESNSFAEKIFSFIDEVRMAPVNNGFFAFEFARDIISLLRKQWAGMFFDFLQDRVSSNEFKVTTNLLTNISIAGEKVEELVKNLYRHMDEAGADAMISNVEKRVVAKEFFKNFFADFSLGLVGKDCSEKLITTPREGIWYEYLAKATNGRIEGITWREKEETTVFWGDSGIVVDIPDSPNSEISLKSGRQQERFEIVKQLSQSELRDVLNDLNFVWGKVGDTPVS